MEVTQPTTGGETVPVTLRDLELLRGAGSVESLGAYRIVDGTLVDPQRAAIRISAAFLTREVLSSASRYGKSPTRGTLTFWVGISCSTGSIE